MTIQGFSAKVVATLSPLLFAAVFFPQTALSTTFGEIHRFSPSDSDNVLFGGAVSISGDTAIVGRDMYNRRGSAYIFRCGFKYEVQQEGQCRRITDSVF